MKIFCFVVLTLLAVKAEASTLTVTVLDQENSPVSGVAVQVGPEPGIPFLNNAGVTGADGIVEFDASSVKQEVNDTPITLVAAGHPKITYFNQTGMAFSLQLPPPILESQAFLSGDFVNWELPAPSHESKAKFGLFMPFMESEKLFAFKMSDLLSSQIDTFSVLNKPVYVPSNLVLPKQTVFYTLIPITLNKPTFRLPVATPATYSFQALTGEFPFEKVAKALLDGQVIFDVANELTMQRFGLLTDQHVSGPIDNLHMNINQNKIASCLKVGTKNHPTPKVAGLVFTRAPELVGKPYQPTDIKRLDLGPQNLGCIQNDTRRVNAMALSMNYHMENNVTIFHKGMSSILARNIPHAQGIANFTLQSYFAVPQLQVFEEGKQVTSTRPEREGISPTSSAVYAILSNVTENIVGDVIVEEVKPQWIVFGNSTLEKIQLPVLASQLTSQDTTPGATFRRWEYVWLGLEPGLQFDNQQLFSVNIGYDLFEHMTHAARNAINF